MTRLNDMMRTSQGKDQFEAIEIDIKESVFFAKLNFLSGRIRTAIEELRDARMYSDSSRATGFESLDDLINILKELVELKNQ